MNSWIIVVFGDSKQYLGNEETFQKAKQSIQNSFNVDSRSSHYSSYGERYNNEYSISSLVCEGEYIQALEEEIQKLNGYKLDDNVYYIHGFHEALVNNKMMYIVMTA